MKTVEYLLNWRNWKDPEWFAFHLIDTALLFVTIFNFF